MKVKIHNAVEAISKNVSEICLGLIFCVYGMSGFLNFFSSPTPLPSAHEFLYGLSTAPYFFPLLKGVEVFCGLALVFNNWVKLSLVALAPIIVNIVLFHAFLDFSHEAVVIPAIVVVFYLSLLWKHRKDLKFLMERK